MKENPRFANSQTRNTRNTRNTRTHSYMLSYKKWHIRETQGGDAVPQQETVVYLQSPLSIPHMLMRYPLFRTCRFEESQESKLNIVIPQFDQTTGRCWWTSLWFVILAADELKKMFLKHVDDTMTRHTNISCFLRAACPGSLLNESELLRKKMFHLWNIGDDPSIHPSLEGRDGMFEFRKMLTLLNIPHNTHPPEASVWIKDYFRRRARPTLRLRSKRQRSIQFDLVAVFIGNEEANHQIAVVPNDSYTLWRMADSDASINGIGEICWTSDRKNWLRDFVNKIPIFDIQGEAYSFSPDNITKTCVTRQGPVCDTQGKLNTHWIYVRRNNNASF